MTVHKVPKPKKTAHKKITGPKVVYLRRDPASSEPFKVQIFRGSKMTNHKSFINKTAALEWIELNAKCSELRDLTGSGKVRSHVCSD